MVPAAVELILHGRRRESDLCAAEAGTQTRTLRHDRLALRNTVCRLLRFAQRGLSLCTSSYVPLRQPLMHRAVASAPLFQKIPLRATRRIGIAESDPRRCPRDRPVSSARAESQTESRCVSGSPAGGPGAAGDPGQRAPGAPRAPLERGFQAPGGRRGDGADCAACAMTEVRGAVERGMP